MKKKYYYSLFVIGLFICFALIIVSSQPGHAGGTGVTVSGVKPSAQDYTDRMIVVYRDASIVRAAAAGKESARVQSQTRLEGLRAKTGINLKHARFMSGDGQVLHLPQKMTLSEARELAARLMENPAVKYAEPDVRMFPVNIKEPNDPGYSLQWHYHEATYEPGSVNLPAAWNITTGSKDIVVAVIDTGYLPHKDFDEGRIVPGYDFISGDKWKGEWCFDRAQDGDGRDPDPKDEGDWITQEEYGGEDEATGGLFEGCPVTDSSWHGTHVAGTIGAHTDNGLGVAGIDWKCKILHARVLGKCGGFTSDIVDAIRWSAGGEVPGVEKNKNPANVLNLSLGEEGECSSAFQDAINDVIARGAVVVVAAGNENDNVSKYQPANCNGVISVAAVNRQGGRASYSNYGEGVTIAAPGGTTETLLDPNGVWSLLNSGLAEAVIPGGDIYRPYQGTSMAAPHVSGVIALLLSRENGLTPAQIKERIVSTARAFPTGTGRDCKKSTCGAGIIDAYTLLAGNPTPSIEGMSPESAWAGLFKFTLTVTGENFSYSSVIRWNGKDRQTTYVSPTCLEAAITAGDIALAGNYPVSVFTPAPGGGETDELTFEVKNVPSGGGGGCFIATAAFGSPLEKHVRILRDFRDRRLLTNGPGRAFVKFYYEVSPVIAAKISQSTTGRFVTRIALMPLVGAAYISLHGGWSVALPVLVFFVLLLLIVAGRLHPGRRSA